MRKTSLCNCGLMCDEKLRLSLAYDDATEMLAAIAADFEAAVHDSPEDFQAKRQQYVSALAGVREARRALWKHRQEHRC
jgi:hypothetical protein